MSERKSVANLRREEFRAACVELGSIEGTTIDHVLMMWPRDYDWRTHSTSYFLYLAQGRQQYVDFLKRQETQN